MFVIKLKWSVIEFRMYRTLGRESDGGYRLIIKEREREREREIEWIDSNWSFDSDGVGIELKSPVVWKTKSYQVGDSEWTLWYIGGWLD